MTDLEQRAEVACPFCNGLVIEYSASRIGRWLGAARCDGCGANIDTAQQYDTSKEAIEAATITWNTRVPSDHLTSTDRLRDALEAAAGILEGAARTWTWEASEEEGFEYRNKVCAERCALYGIDCQEDEPRPGACEECKSDMHEHFETQASKERRRELRELAQRIRSLPLTSTPAPSGEREALNERAVMVCPQCEGEGGYADGLDEAACHTECTRCGGNGWIVDRAALQGHAS